MAARARRRHLRGSWAPLVYKALFSTTALWIGSGVSAGKAGEIIPCAFAETDDVDEILGDADEKIEPSVLQYAENESQDIDAQPSAADDIVAESSEPSPAGPAGERQLVDIDGPPAEADTRPERVIEQREVPPELEDRYAEDDEPLSADTEQSGEPQRRVSDRQGDTPLPPPPPFRVRPGEQPRRTFFPPFNYESVPDINTSTADFPSVEDRWRELSSGTLYDPYNQNPLKGDFPAFGSPGHEWFVELGAVSNSLFERRRIPLPVGNASTAHAQENNTFGNGLQSIFVQNFIPSFSLIRGNTTFRPQDFELRVVPVINLNRVESSETGVLFADPARGKVRNDQAIGFEELFVDYHLVNISDRYDFISTRVGIQHFVSDFRGFIFADEEPGVRLFGNWDNNKWQYNLAFFDRLEKDTNSGVNSMFHERYENVLVANLFRQDAPVYGHTLQGSILYREDNAGDHGQRYDGNGFLVRPSALGDERFKNIYSTYFGLNGDGHFGRINTTSALYYVTGSESHNPIAEREVQISAGMAALELSYDVNWIRYRVSGFWASGDSDPFDGKATGFDAIFDRPNFAGGGNSFINREGIPLIGGGGVNLFNSQSLLPDLRPGKEKGQSNFVNPGLRLYNVGVDFDVLPELRLITNASFLQFDQTAVLRALRQDGSISRNIGYDLSAGVLYRPFLNNNVQIHGGTGALFTESGFDNLFGDNVLFDVFTDVTLLY